jgi:hypothetical protein
MIDQSKTGTTTSQVIFITLFSSKILGFVVVPFTSLSK